MICWMIVDRFFAPRKGFSSGAGDFRAGGFIRHGKSRIRPNIKLDLARSLTATDLDYLFAED